MKDVLRDLIALVKEELAEYHVSTDCGGDPEPQCLSGSAKCKEAWRCSKSYRLAARLDDMAARLEKEQL